MSTQNPGTEARHLLLKIVLPDRQPETLRCDAVRLTVKDSLKGKNGGLYGIRPGHAPALFLLDEGITEAFSAGETVGKYVTGDGFARVENDTVTVVTGSAEAC